MPAGCRRPYTSEPWYAGDALTSTPGSPPAVPRRGGPAVTDTALSLADGERRRDTALALLAERRAAVVCCGQRALLICLLDTGTATADDVRAAVELPPGIGPRCYGGRASSAGGAGHHRCRRLHTDPPAGGTRPPPHPLGTGRPRRGAGLARRPPADTRPEAGRAGATDTLGPILRHGEPDGLRRPARKTYGDLLT